MPKVSAAGVWTEPFDRIELSEVAVPFLDPAHVSFSDRLRAWCADNADLWARPIAGPVENTCMGIVRRLGDGGWFGFLDPRTKPDGRWDFRSICLSREILAHADDLADFAFSIQALAAMPLARHGTAAQQDRYLGEMAAGRLLGSFAISELDAGSDVAALGLMAERTADGWVLNGSKAWIAQGGVADVHTVIARTGGGPGILGLSAFLVPAGTPGLTIGERLSVLAPRPLAHLAFRDCLVTDQAMLGRPGQGFVIAMELLEHFRMTVGAAAVGLARHAAEYALEHARTRRMGTGHLFDLLTVKATFADMETQLSAAWLLVLRAAWEVDTGRRRFAKHSSIAKLFATECAQRIVDEALQISGASGVVSESIPEQLYRQVRLLRIYEGTSEIQRATIAGLLDFATSTSARATGGPVG